MTSWNERLRIIDLPVMSGESGAEEICEVRSIYDGDDIQENLNLAMVWAGRAVVYPRYCDDDQYFLGEKEAQRLKSGLWEKFGVWQTPWKSRAPQ